MLLTLRRAALSGFKTTHPMSDRVNGGVLP
jgi:hypothetical protein